MIFPAKPQYLGEAGDQSEYDDTQDSCGCVHDQKYPKATERREIDPSGQPEADDTQAEYGSEYPVADSSGCEELRWLKHIHGYFDENSKLKQVTDGIEHIIGLDVMIC